MHRILVRKIFMCTNHCNQNVQHGYLSVMEDSKTGQIFKNCTSPRLDKTISLSAVAHSAVYVSYDKLFLHCILTPLGPDSDYCKITCMPCAMISVAVCNFDIVHVIWAYPLMCALCYARAYPVIASTKKWHWLFNKVLSPKVTLPRGGGG